MTIADTNNAHVVERSQLLADYQRWRMNFAATPALAPGQGLAWLIDDHTEMRGFVLDVSDRTATVLTRHTAMSGHDHAADVRIQGVIGAAWPVPVNDKPSLIVVEETALACAIYQTLRLRQLRLLHGAPLVVAQWLDPPMRLQPSRIVVPHLPKATIAAVPLFEDWNVPSRVADPSGHPGCFEGSAAELIRHYLQNIDWAYRATLSIYTAGSAEFVAEITEETNRHGLAIYPSAVM